MDNFTSWCTYLAEPSPSIVIRYLHIKINHVSINQGLDLTMEMSYNISVAFIEQFLLQCFSLKITFLSTLYEDNYSSVIVVSC